MNANAKSTPKSNILPHDAPFCARLKGPSAQTILKAGVFVALVLPALTAWGQNPAEPAYQGMQPKLVQGVEDGMATGKPKIRHVYLAAPDTLALVIDAQNVWDAPVQKYVPKPGDTIRRTRPQNYGTQGHQFFWDRSIIRNGVNLGNLVGLKEDYYLPITQLKGEALNLAWAESLTNYTLLSPDDAAYQAGATPSAIFRKTKPEKAGWTGKSKQDISERHELYLKLPHALQPGKRYTLRFGSGGQFASPVSFVFDDKSLRTEAIEVTQSGYHPRQAEKFARLYQWLGNGGGVDFSTYKDFLIVDDKTGETKFRGDIALRAPGDPARKQAPEGTADVGDIVPTPVYQMDFSAFGQPGVYRVVVPGLGTSFPFRIDENVWADAAKITARGYLNQRSGIALGPPYTSYTRPRNFYPADGVPIFRTDPAIFFDPVRFPPGGKNNSLFKRIQASILEDQTEPNAWGGWHDAGDYDRSILGQNHARAVHAMLDLYESNPAYFEKLNLNLPESNNKIPDIVDEALWCTDLFLRMQQPDGGIPSAVESIEHPSEPSWLLKQPTAVTPPTPETCYVYAATAARMSLSLQKYDAKRAQTYRDSALRAMEWAAKNPQVPNIYHSEISKVKQNLSLAHLWLYRLTGDQKWHEALKGWFKETYPKGVVRLDTTSDGSGPWTVADYALMPKKQADPVLQSKCRRAVLAAADVKVANTQKWTFALAPQRYSWDERLGLTWELTAAHRLTGDAKYLLAMERSAQFGLGLNPSNTSYTTGIGSRQVVPYQLDARYLGEKYPDGITTLGPAPRNSWRGSVAEKELDAGGLFPAWENWPWAESNFNLGIPALVEHVVGGNMVGVLLTRAYVAQALAPTPGRK